MVNVFIIHGAYGDGTENWIPWLKEELEKEGCDVYVPRFPTPENQSLDNWINVFEEYKEYLDEDTIFVGHSIGVAFLLNVLESFDVNVKASFFVAGFLDKLNNPDFDTINETFYRSHNWIKIKKNCGGFSVFHSDNDPYVPLKYGEEIADKLGVELILVQGAGHFNEKAGYLEFPLLFDNIKKELVNVSNNTSN